MRTHCIMGNSEGTHIAAYTLSSLIKASSELTAKSGIIFTTSLSLHQHHFVSTLSFPSLIKLSLLGRYPVITTPIEFPSLDFQGPIYTAFI